VTDAETRFRRGDVWVAERATKARLVVVVGHDGVSATRSGVLVVPISDVRASTLIEPGVEDEEGHPVGVAMTARAGEVSKEYLTGRHGRLSAASLEALDIALRAIFDL
jgi:mRNA-degrading endonuclease toxin of MazEF toxin-antitoxin module